MDQIKKRKTLEILEGIDDLDYAAQQFYALMLEVQNGDGVADRVVKIEAAKEAGDMIITCHRMQCLAKYVHVLEPEDGKNGLYGQYKLFQLDVEGKPADCIWTLQFDRFGNTELPGSAESVIAPGVVRRQVRNAFVVQIVAAIQGALEGPDAVE